jgi:manganese/zinc/iron transport system substrate-binding protein
VLGVIGNSDDMKASRRQFCRTVLTAAAAGAGVSCEEPVAPSGPRLPKVKWRVVCTTSWAASIAAQVGGEAVDAVSLMKAGMSPHQFKAAAPDVAKLRTADIVLRHGLGLDDAWPVDYPSLEQVGVRLHSVTDSVPGERLIRPGGPEGAPDPHVWMDPQLAVYMVHAVEAALIAAMPRLAEYISPRAQRLRVDLGETDRFLKGLMGELPEKDRFLFTSHASMAYFARAYGLELRSIANAGGQAPQALPDELKAWLSERRVGTLFHEQDTNETVLAALLLGSKVVTGPVIYSLALPAAGTFHTIATKRYDVTAINDAIRYTGDVVQSKLQID